MERTIKAHLDSLPEENQTSFSEPSTQKNLSSMSPSPQRSTTASSSSSRNHNHLITTVVMSHNPPVQEDPPHSPNHIIRLPKLQNETGSENRQSQSLQSTKHLEYISLKGTVTEKEVQSSKSGEISPEGQQPNSSFCPSTSVSAASSASTTSSHLSPTGSWSDENDNNERLWSMSNVQSGPHYTPSTTIRYKDRCNVPDDSLLFACSLAHQSEQPETGSDSHWIQEWPHWGNNLDPKGKMLHVKPREFSDDEEGNDGAGEKGWDLYEILKPRIVGDGFDDIPTMTEEQFRDFKTRWENIQVHF